MYEHHALVLAGRWPDRPQPARRGDPDRSRARRRRVRRLIGSGLVALGARLLSVPNHPPEPVVVGTGQPVRRI